MKKLFPYLRDYKKEVVLAPLFKLLEAVFELFVPLVVAAMIDRGIGGRNTGLIGAMGLLLLLLAAVGLAASVTAQYYAAKAASGFGTSLRQALFHHLQKFEYSDLDRVGESGMITRMTSDINQVQSGVNMVLRLFLRSPVIILGAMIMAFLIDWRSALIFAAVIPLLSLVVGSIMAVTIPLYRRVQKSLERVLMRTKENLEGVRVIRAFGREEEEERAFDKENGALVGLQLLVGRISAVMNPLTYVIVNLAVAGLLYLGAIRVNEGHLTRGALVAILNYMSQILVELIKLANLIVLVTRALACADRVEETLSVLPEKRPISEEASCGEQISGSVEFQDVSLTYGRGAEPALSHISFRAEEGETIGIIGGTGSGKTSLINLIPGFYQATKGKVLVGGRDVISIPGDRIRGMVGMVPQRAVLFRGTIRENLLWGRENASDEELWEALEIAQAKEIVENKSDGLDTMIGQDGRGLSGGQRQRLTIARALARRPRILILDDSSSALDYATDAALRGALRRLKGVTTFIVSQRTSSLQHADRILVLEDGRLLAQGTHESLLRDCGLYREIHTVGKGEA